MMTLLAQIDVTAVKEATDVLAAKDTKWLLTALLVVGVLFVGFIIKWLLAAHERQQTGMETQLSEQRAKDAAKDAALLEYLRDDRAKMLEVLAACTAALREQNTTNRILNGVLNRIAPGTLPAAQA